jgi:D-alanyl-lipoteichoic acid acyltransferase DltB (MBOAT superfamily)
MIFTTIPFFFFLVIVLGLYWILPSDRWRHPFLLFANFFFYGWWDWRFTTLLAVVIFVSYIAGKGIENAEGGSWLRKYVMIGACTLLLGVLGYFKYTNFFLGSLQGVIEQIGGHLSWTTLKIILPAGISFYIFQAISYLVTVYRGKLVAEQSIVKLGVYLSFFPHLVAGPIIHAPTFLPQLAQKRFFEDTLFVEGARKFALGFLYKAVFADHLAAVVNPIFATLLEQKPLILFGGCLGFYGQIYFDFAGYSLMAIGVANLLGYTLPDNFHFPYRATSLVDFWHRWHISLSTWLRDYLYIPLGGNRCSVSRNYFNIIVTMLLGGLWHGASWNYLIWGGIHGVALCINHLWRRLTDGRVIFPKALSWFFTQAVVFFCWIPFRAATLQETIFIGEQFAIGLKELLSMKLFAFSPTIITFPWLLVVFPLFF